MFMIIHIMEVNYDDVHDAIGLAIDVWFICFNRLIILADMAVKDIILFNIAIASYMKYAKPIMYV